MRKLEIGSGNRPQEGYEHLDIDPNCPHLEYVCPMDKISVEDNAFDEIISIHVIEHQSWRDGEKILREWYRVLNKNGMLYIATPNLKFIAEMYIDGIKGGRKWLQDYKILHEQEKEFININGVPSLDKWANFKIFSSTGGGDNHYALYDSKTLVALMEKVGFKDIIIQNDSDSLVIKGFKR
jgi:predicted SAM-dependent methyltransferase